MWTKPAATEMRFGFEVTMYVCNRQVALLTLKDLRVLFYYINII